eukprot:6467014-Pyramimonas_sp.AAC.1
MPSTYNARSRLMTVMYGRDSSRLTSIVINISGDFAGEFSDTIVAEGAVSCSVEDANKGTPNEQEMFQAGSLAGEKAFVYRDPEEDEWLSSRGMWDQSRLIALFPQDVDIAEAVATASAILGMEPPTYESLKSEESSSISSRLYGRVPLHVGQAGLFTNKYSKLPPGLVGWNACQVKGVVDEDWVQKVKDAFIAVEVRQSEDW